MQDRTCPACGETFTPTWHNQIACPPTEADRARQKKGQARSQCARRIENMRYQSQREDALCQECGDQFSRVKGRAQHVYCSEPCHHKAKAARYSEMYRTARVTWPPKVGAHDAARYKRSLRQDPCSYCGLMPCGGVDHIEPTGEAGDRKDWTNMTGCCKRCNETKHTLPLLLALPWIPISRQYHDSRRALFAPRCPSAPQGVDPNALSIA